MQKHAVKQHEVDALELEVEQARIKAMVPTQVPSPEHVTPVPTPQPSDAGSAVNGEGAISDFDLPFGDDRVPSRSRKWIILHSNGFLLLLRTHVILNMR